MDIEIVTHKKEKEAKFELICCHFAGGGANYFKSWAKYLRPEIGLSAIRLPGRENTYNQKPYKEIQEFIEILAFKIKSSFQSPVILFGHSMGGLIVFELSKQLLKNNVDLAQLYISAYGHPLKLNNLSRHHLSDENLFEFIFKNRLTKVTPKMQNEIVRFMLPTIRADYSICDSYQYKKSDIMDIPITIFGGKDDFSHPVEALSLWQQETKQKLKMKIFEGGHFYIDEKYQNIIEIINNCFVI